MLFFSFCVTICITPGWIFLFHNYATLAIILQWSSHLKTLLFFNRWWLLPLKIPFYISIISLHFITFLHLSLLYLFYINSLHAWLSHFSLLFPESLLGSSHSNPASRAIQCITDFLSNRPKYILGKSLWISPRKFNLTTSKHCIMFCKTWSSQ